MKRLAFILLLSTQAFGTVPLTAAKINNTVYVDGTTYALSAAGVQAAINAGCNGPAQGQVVLPPGSISLNITALVLPNNCDIGGQGQGATTLTFLNSAATVFFSLASNANNVRIHDLTMDGGSGTNVNESCIVGAGATAPSDITVERVTCQNVGAHGIYITGTAANPGKRIVVRQSKILNAGLVCPGASCSGNQLYGILVSYNSHVSVSDNEISGGGVTAGIVAFSSINASAASPIVDIQFTNNRIHDLPFNSTPGGAIDVGRARQVVVAHNIVYNLAQGACVIFEAVWGGSMSSNECSVADTVLTGGPFVVKTPDTTQSGEVASQDISIIGNTVIDNSPVATVNSSIVTNGAQRNLVMKGNAISVLNQASNNTAIIYLQLGTNDANIAAASQNFCSVITVDGNTITNRSGTSSATAAGIQLQQVSTACTPDQIVISNNTINGFNKGLYLVSAAASNGVTHAYVHDNAVEGNTTAFAADGKSYSSVYIWNNLAPNGNGVISNTMPPEPFSRFRLSDSGQCTMTAGTCAAQNLSATYTNPPLCMVTWTGTGALAGVLKVASTTTQATPSSTNGADTAVVNWACTGN